MNEFNVFLPKEAGDVSYEPADTWICEDMIIDGNTALHCKSRNGNAGDEIYVNFEMRNIRHVVGAFKYGFDIKWGEIGWWHFELGNYYGFPYSVVYPLWYGGKDLGIGGI